MSGDERGGGGAGCGNKPRRLAHAAGDDGTPLYRHRLFEMTHFCFAPGHPKHTKVLVPGRLLKGRARLTNGYVVGEHQNGIRAMGAMGIDWMTGIELSQAIPPAYTEFIGRQLMAALRVTV